MMAAAGFEVQLRLSQAWKDCSKSVLHTIDLQACSNALIINKFSDIGQVQM